MTLVILDIEIDAGDVVSVRLSRGFVEIEAIFYAGSSDRVATLSRLDIQGAGKNTTGWSVLRQMAQEVMEFLDVDELRIEGTTRASGANPGRRPTPLVFRRIG